MQGLAKPSAVPVTILTGFLGAGKTTLLNRILTGDHGLRVGVLVNDFGAINIDAELVVGVENDIISLANGCVCCQIRDDLVESVISLIDRPGSVEYILLEASGVADPGPISTTFVDAELRHRIRLDSVTCVVDAEQVFEYEEYPAVKLLKLKQIGFADMVVLNKIDLAGTDKVARARQWIDEQFNRVRVIESSHCCVPLEILLSVGRFDPTQLQVAAAQPDDTHVAPASHGHSFQTWTYETAQPMSVRDLREMIKRRLPAHVFRCKGVVRTAEQPERRAILQCVGRRTDVTFADMWGERLPSTKIVVIAAPGGVNPEELAGLFNGCTAQREGTADARGY